MKIIYEGKNPEIMVLGIGSFKKGEIADVSPEEAERLLRIQGFREKITKKKGKGGEK